MKKLRTIIPLLLALALVISACSGQSPASMMQSSSAAAQVTVAVTRGPLISSISAIGALRSAQTSTLTWQASGKVGEVAAQVGQEVKEGDIMASLDPTTLPQSILQAQISLINAQKALDALLKPTELQIAQAQAALEQAQKSLDDLQNPSETALAQAQAALLTAQDNVKTAQEAVTALGYGRGTEANVSAARADYLLAQEKVDQLQARYDNLPGDPATDSAKASSLSALNAAIVSRDRALANLNWYSSTPTASEVAEKQNNLALANAKLADAEQALAALQNPSAVDIALAKAKVTDAQQKLDTYLKGPAADDLTIAQTNVTSAQANLNAAYIIAPFDATVTDIQVNSGDQVSGGKTAFRVDDLSKLYVDLSVNEIDYPLVKVGQQVTVTLDALTNKSYSGQVYKVGNVGITTSNVVNFSVTVLLTNPDESAKPGMTAVAYIQIARVDSVLQVPSQSIQSNGGKYYVYLSDGSGGSTQTQVQVGISSDLATEVISTQIKEGDLILLTPPASLRGFGGGGGGEVVVGPGGGAQGGGAVQP